MLLRTQKGMMGLKTTFEILLATISIFMSQVHMMYGIDVQINENFTGTVGEVGEINCSFAKEDVRQIFTVAFFIRSKTINEFVQIVTFLPETVTAFTPSGEYLRNRVTVTNITQNSTQATMTFLQLNCTDQNQYRCQVNYLSTDNRVLEATSLPTTINVTVLPQKPYISSSFETTSPDSHHNVKKRSIPESEIFNETSVTLKTIENDQEFSPSTSTTTVAERGQFPQEGDNITFVCSGNVGRPPGLMLWQKIPTYNNRSFNYINETTTIEKIQGNCSLNGTSNLTFQLSADDFKAKIRCSVVSQSGVHGKYIETDPLDFYFGVKHVSIIKLPNKDIFDPSIKNITLTCNSNGNPEPRYTWYKRQNTSTILSRLKKYVITHVIQNNSGMYICEVHNFIRGEKYNASSFVEISIEKINKTSEDKTNNYEKKIYLLIGMGTSGVFFILAVIIASAFCRRRANRKSLLKGKEETTSKSFSENCATNNQCYTSDSGTRINDNSNDSGNAMDTRNDKLKNEEKLVVNHPINLENSRREGYDSVVIDGDKPVISSEKNSYGHDDPQTIRQRNEEHIDHQKQEEKKINKSPIPNQTVEYAQVNEATKLKNKTKSNDTDQTRVNVGASAISQKGINGKSKDMTTEITDHIDTPKKNTTRDETESLNKSRLRERNNTQSFVNDDKEKGKVAIVSPFVGSSVKSEGDMQKENTNAEIQQEIEDISGQTVDNAQNFDTNNQKNQETNGDPEPSLKYNQTEPHTNQTFDSEEYPQIDSVSMNDIQYDGQVDQNSEQQSSNDYEKVQIEQNQ